MEVAQPLKILALQLKRIGDLVLTTPALASIKKAHPEAHLTLAVHSSTAGLLPAIPHIDAGVVFGPGRGWTPWQQTLTGNFNHVLDFTGTDRSAAAVAMSRSRKRITFDWVRKNRVRALAYTRFVDSPVREHHTIDHYRHLAESVLRLPNYTGDPDLELPRLEVPTRASEATQSLLSQAGVRDGFVLIHPGTARREKYWEPERWAEVIGHLRFARRLDCVITAGTDEFEQDHVREIVSAQLVTNAAGGKLVELTGKVDLLGLADVVRRAALVVSCDTAVVHLAAAFRKPQVALFGPTNPYHWRPRHAGAIVLSAGKPDGPLVDFTPRMKGGPMERLSTEVVIRATESLLS